MLPADFRPLAAVVSDLRHRARSEILFEEFLQQRGAVLPWLARWWKPHRSSPGTPCTRPLFRQLRSWTDTCISFGDHFAADPNMGGLTEQRARISALSSRAYLRQDRWGRLIHVPSAGDIGAYPRRLERKLLSQTRRYAEFEHTPQYRELLRGAVDTHPELTEMLCAPSDRSAHCLIESLRWYRSLFGPSWSVQPLGPYTLVWASDVLLRVMHEEIISAPSLIYQEARAQRVFLCDVFAMATNVILCVRDPLVLPIIKRDVFYTKMTPTLRMTICGAPPVSWSPGQGCSRAIRADFSLTFCPPLNAQRPASLLIGERDGILETMLYERAVSETESMIVQ